MKVILGSSAQAALLSEQPAFFLWRFDQQLTTLCVTNEQEDTVALHGKILDQSTTGLIISFDVGTDEVARFKNSVGPSELTTASTLLMMLSQLHGVRLCAFEIHDEALKFAC
jgi:hypothetical protein